METTAHMAQCGSASHRSLASAISLLLCALAAASCSTPMPPAVPVSPPTDSIVAAESTPPLQSVASSVDGYKREVARAIYRNNPESLFDGAPPPLLRAVVVLSLSIDPNGHLSRVNVIRSNGYRDLEEIAVRSVRRTATLPMPSRVVAPKGTAEFVETWLFRDDGRFQIRSLAEVQARAD